ncbi:TM1266 family iron-only hydrogenase system putative regulator [Anaerotignum sp.]|uniref:TM1266 family iron-only hydrogenase system putative regulator n=1 Tax=Anaerotignum sp. TaxID=2039241 RepID=UPI0027144B4B|nr:TM1266 family iron-only hydrogenase system putative regulator [Anaerotignum sp.]
METRVAIIGIIVEEIDSVSKLNSILHDYGTYIIGRMGIPYREKKINIISVVVDAPNDIISTLSGKLGRLPGVSTKTVYSKYPTKTNEE